MAEDVRITFLGGLGEIGRNCAAIEQDGRIVLIDCGLMFPDTDMPGVDLVLPDFTWLRERADDIDGCVLTHGHEDHVGALSYLLREISVPLYGSALTLGMARGRIEEAGLLKQTSLHPVRDGERVTIGPFDVEFIPVTHSVPHGFAVAFHTAQGVIFHTGDWKLDLTPVDNRTTDLARIGALGAGEGIRLMLGDSTNAEEAGHTTSERAVGEVLEHLIGAAGGRRVIVACFASHIHRIQQIADAAVAHSRTVATLGRSMGRNVRLARDMGLLHIPDHALVDIDDAGDIPDENLCIVSTGSQGEPMSALSLMAAGDNRWIKVGDNDLIVLSSHPIPGNESSVSKVIDGLHRRGADVVHTGLAKVHVSGHAKREELKTLISLAEPEWFVPVHGEYRHLVHHARLAESVGVPAEQVLISLDGDQLVLGDNGLAHVGRVPSGYLYVDGSGIGDIGHGVLRDRKVLAEEGVVVVIVTIDVDRGEIVSGPEIITRGWVHAEEAEDLLDEARKEVRVAIEAGDTHDLDAVRRHARKALGQFVNNRTRRRPMIVPVVMEA